MSAIPPASSGWSGLAASAKRVGHSLLGLVRTRVELFAVELQEEKLRALNLLLWAAVAVALVMTAVLFTLGTIALFLWQRAGFAGLAGLVAGVLLAAAGVVIYLRRTIQRGPAPFAATTAEFQKDMEWLRRE